MAYITRTRQVLLNPAEKSRKYAIELRHNRALTNDGNRKYNEDGSPKKLTEVQRAFRAGYLTRQSDCNKAFRSKHPNYKRKTTKNK